MKEFDKGRFKDSEQRAWAIFLKARFAISLILILVYLVLYPLDEASIGGVQKGVRSHTLALTLTLYLAETIAVYYGVIKRSFFHKRQGLLWFLTLGVDLLIFFWVYWDNEQTTSLLTLFIFPILLAATLGARWMIHLIGGAVMVMVALRAGVLEASFYHNTEDARLMIPQILAVGGIWVLGFVTRSSALRLQKEEQRAFWGQATARQQKELNRLIVSEMSTGVVISDSQASLRMINPAAVDLITGEEGSGQQTQSLDELNETPGWKQLQDIIHILFESAPDNRWLIFDFILEQGDKTRMLQIKGCVLAEDEEELELNLGLEQLMPTLEDEVKNQKMCVLFLTDMQSVSARLQQEKLAAMGRVSASIAHEIRNPLATISSANTLLSEGLTDQGSLRLSEMIGTNVDRLEQIVKEVLEIVHLDEYLEASNVSLLDVLPEIVNEWVGLYRWIGDRVYTSWPDDVFGIYINFDEEHLRRILVNLLDNALRYASQDKGAIFVALSTYEVSGIEKAKISVYSDGAPLESQVIHSLFEPFFSTEARGTGLGLYICRNLCNRYDAEMGYRRATLEIGEEERDYNEFFIVADRIDPLPGETQILLEQVK